MYSVYKFFGNTLDKNYTDNKCCYIYCTFTGRYNFENGKFSIFHTINANIFEFLLTCLSCYIFYW